jgi:hypothetical protein
MLTEAAISEDRYVIMKEAEKILIYKDLRTVTKHIWNAKRNIVPVIRGAIGTMSQSLIKYLSNIAEKQEIKELQKTAILGITYIL